MLIKSNVARNKKIAQKQPDIDLSDKNDEKNELNEQDSTTTPPQAPQLASLSTTKDSFSLPANAIFTSSPNLEAKSHLSKSKSAFNDLSSSSSPSLSTPFETFTIIDKQLPDNTKHTLLFDNRSIKATKVDFFEMKKK